MGRKAIVISALALFALLMGLLLFTDLCAGDGCYAITEALRGLARALSML